MVRYAMVAVAAIPAILATMIAIPMVTQPEIPYSAVNAGDEIEIEYSRHAIEQRTDGIIERMSIRDTEILLIRDDGRMQYVSTQAGAALPEIDGDLDEKSLERLTAMIKETGFITIKLDPFSIRDNATQYTKHSIRITLNGIENQIQWPDQNATDELVPPIVAMVGTELDDVINRVIKYK